MSPSNSLPNERSNRRGSTVRRRRELHRQQAVKRRGAAVTELAVTIPLIALVVMSTIETCSMLFLKQALRIAAYEGARVSLVPGSQTINVEAGCNEILTARKVKNAKITITPADFNQQPYGTVVKVKVSADCASNSLFVPWVFTGRTISSELSMMIER